jgi:glucose dehydrogenase
MTRARIVVGGVLAAGAVTAGLVTVGAQGPARPGAPATPAASGAAATSAGEWRTYGGDLASTRYSALDQINPSNFGSLRIAWRFRTDNFGPRPEIQLQATPLYADGALYDRAAPP